METKLNEYSTFKSIGSFLIYAILEWVLIIMLFAEGLISFTANVFSHYFGLKIPCLFCTRIDHVLVRRDPDSYYKSSICGVHGKEVSSLAYCHIHQRLSDIRRMCEGCLLSFATENKSNSETYKSLVGILGGDLECSVEADHKIHLKLPAGGKEDQFWVVEKNSIHHCSCCNEPLRTRSKFSQRKPILTKVSDKTSVPETPIFSMVVSDRESEAFGLDPMSHIRYTELKFTSDTESEIPDDESGLSAVISESFISRDGTVVDPDEQLRLLEPDVSLTGSPDGTGLKEPSYDGDSSLLVKDRCKVYDSPRAILLRKRFQAQLNELGTEAFEEKIVSEVDGESIVHRLQRRVHLDRKSLIALYMELDEERNASAIAANQAMAMITRLQEEKAAVQMDALQYQRMMEEQAEYDQEALQAMKELLTKRDKEIKFLEAEVESYRDRLHCESPEYMWRDGACYADDRLQSNEEHNVQGGHDDRKLKFRSYSVTLRRL